LHTLLIANMAKSASMDDHHLGCITKLEKKKMMLRFKSELHVEYHWKSVTLGKRKFWIFSNSINNILLLTTLSSIVFCYKVKIFNPCEMDVWWTFEHVTKVGAWELFSSKVGPLDENKG